MVSQTPLPNAQSPAHPLSQAFLAYLRADGIILPPEHKHSTADPEDSGYEDGAGEDENEDPSESWSEIHERIIATIKELGGKVIPKLNWSAPKDATWIATTNDMECRTPNDIYLLLKSSDFITHDLEHAFDGCTIDDGETAPEVPYHLILRKSFNLNPSLEFRCFIRRRRLIAISQREMNHFAFLFDLRPQFQRLIRNFLEEKLLAKEGGFPDENFVVDVYIPPPHDRVWLIDVNPWAPRTDPLLFSWLELLTMQVPEGEEARSESDDDGPEEFVRPRLQPPSQLQPEQQPNLSSSADTQEPSSSPSIEPGTIFTPEFRLVHRDDPEAYQFSATKYSAHKLPKEVVDASMVPGEMKNMMEEWRKVLDRQVSEEEEEEES